DTQEIPIIFMTALTDTVDKVKGFNLGAADYITKPIQHEEVLARVNTHLNLRKLQKQMQDEINLRKEVQGSLLTTNNALAERTIELQARSEELQERTIELEKRNMELDAFAHTVAHDLKNPLGAIINLTEVLLETCSCESPKWQQRLQIVAQAAQQIHTIIDAILLLAGVSRQAELKIQTLDMAAIVAEVQQRLTPMIDTYQAEIQVPASWPWAQGYAPWIEEVWSNYLTNGLKYGGRPPRLQLGANRQATGMIRFWVRDNGIGLTPEAQAQLFTPLTRLHQDRVEGHGLGLSIVKQIIEKLEGEVGVESSPNQGSVFYFTLPQTVLP
ncbi:MAG: ATP-binding protein, partial [Pseudomonadota bacterium]|nr:ATP-binding protein [Pseudomonadota bacterium]